MRIIDTLRRKRPSGWDYSCTACGWVMSGLETGPSIRLIRHHIATAHPELAGSATEGFAPKIPAVRCDCDTDPSLITFTHARRHAPDAVPASWPTEVTATYPKVYGQPTTELFIAPDASGELYVWGPHPTRPDLPVVLGGLPREGLFREWLLANLPTRNDEAVESSDNLLEGTEPEPGALWPEIVAGVNAIIDRELPKMLARVLFLATEEDDREGVAAILDRLVEIGWLPPIPPGAMAAAIGPCAYCERDGVKVHREVAGGVCADERACWQAYTAQDAE